MNRSTGLPGRVVPGVDDTGAAVVQKWQPQRRGRGRLGEHALDVGVERRLVVGCLPHPGLYRVGLWRVGQQHGGDARSGQAAVNLGPSSGSVRPSSCRASRSAAARSSATVNSLIVGPDGCKRVA